MAHKTHILRRLEATEADILNTITEYLEIQMAQGKLLYIRHSPSNVVGKKGEATFRRMKQSQLGASDLIVLRLCSPRAHLLPVLSFTDVLCIEVKSIKGQLSPAQSRWRGLVLAQGCSYIIARSLEDVKKALKEIRNLIGGDPGLMTLEPLS